MRLRFPQGPWLAAAGAVALFFIANRGAYQGWFSDDDLDNLGWTTIVGWDVFRDGWLSPFFSADNFRPTGHVAYRLLDRVFPLGFGRWVLVLQLVHLVNTALVFFACRRWGAPVRGAVAGSALFVFHPALLAAFWKPMYVFDLLCGSFLLASFLLYGSGWRWVASIVAFWLAYKAKEVAIFFPLVLAMLEFLGERRWWRLSPFFLISASFGAQALIGTRGRDSDYALRFTAKDWARCATFYLWESWYVPVALAACAWDRRVWFGLAAFVGLAGPLWFLPGRLFAVYLYVPMIGLALAAAIVFARARIAVLVTAVAAWWAFGFVQMREFRKAELTRAISNRAYFDQTCAAVRAVPKPAKVYHEGNPPYMALHGIEGTLHRCYGDPRLPLIPLDLTAGAPPEENGAVILSWDGRRSTVWPPGTGPWRLGPGWTPLLGTFRWMRPQAAVRLQPAPGDRWLVVRARRHHAQPDQRWRIRLDGKLLDEVTIVAAGAVERRYAITPTVKLLEMTVEPGFDAPGFGQVGLAVEEVAVTP